MAGRKPDFNVRAKTGRKDDQDRDIFMTIGAGWNFNQGDGINVQISALPVGFDGHLMIVVPKDDER